MLQQPQAPIIKTQGSKNCSHYVPFWLVVSYKGEHTQNTKAEYSDMTAPSQTMLTRIPRREGQKNKASKSKTEH